MRNAILALMMVCLAGIFPSTAPVNGRAAGQSSVVSAK
jgi:hypothetical protein